jgi:hypothetical protein
LLGRVWSWPVLNLYKDVQRILHSLDSRNMRNIRKRPIHQTLLLGMTRHFPCA